MGNESPVSESTYEEDNPVRTVMVNPSRHRRASTAKVVTDAAITHLLGMRRCRRDWMCNLK